MIKRVIKVMDLFSGCGGLSYGFENAGYEIVVGIDNWEDSLKTFKINHKNAQTLNIDLKDINPKIIEKVIKIKKGEIDVIIGGPPCQGFSISGKRLVDDPRNKLYKSFVSLVEYYKPEAFLMENVPNLVGMAGGKVKDQIIEDFEFLGYKVTYKILLASNFGVPQNRRRVIFVGLKNNTKFEFPEETHSMDLFHPPYITTKEALDDLPENDLPDGAPYPQPPTSDYQKLMRKGSQTVNNHQTVKHTKKTIDIISLVPDGGNYKNLPTELQNTRKVNIAWMRMNSKKPSHTIDTGHNHYFHYKWNRVPSPRESARIQSFPDKFIFSGNIASQLKQVGNAVPPLMSYALAKKLIYYLQQQ